MPKVPVSKCRIVLGLIAVFVTAVGVAHAQQAPERIPLYVLDVHAATVGLPQAEGWVPPFPVTTTRSGTITTTTATVELPGRNWGAAGGATVYPIRFRAVAFGVGAGFITGSGRAETKVITGTGTAAKTTVTRIVHTGIMSVVPHLSINFGHKAGWSYLSAGAGTSKVRSRSEAIGTAPEVVMPEAWSQALNFGGGARWFMKAHLGAGFDARWVKLMSRGATAALPSAKRTQMWNISAGISIQ